MRVAQIVTLALAAGISGCLFAGDRGEHGDALPAVDNGVWRTECGSCHIAYPPALLPERSWRRIMGGLDRHFGENASLDAVTRQQIAAFLAANAADRVAARRARKIAASIAPTATPLRISETPWFAHKHDELSPDVWQRREVGSAANCAACHPGADRGRFDEDEIAVPRAGRRRE